MSSSVSARLTRWNRKAHYYLGLYFLFFLWLFLLTGLMLNHGTWSWVQSANARRESKYERPVTAPSGDTDLARARDIMRQLRLTGEPDLPATQAPGRFDFSVARPSEANQVRVDLATLHASVQHFDNSRWALVRIFHTFSGARYNAPATRDWALTTMWVIAMDALAAGLIVMVLGSYWMWFQLKRVHTLGWIMLGAGFLCCALMMKGLQTDRSRLTPRASTGVSSPASPRVP